MRLLVLVVGLATLLVTPRRAGAVQVEALDPLRDWRLRAIDFVGLQAVSRSDLLAVMTTRPRTWFAIWRAWPPFDAIAFGSDLAKLGALYRSRGYYHAVVTHDVDVDWDSGLVRVTIWVDEGPPVRVRTLDVDVTAPPADVPGADVLRAGLPLDVDDTFDEGDYDAGRLRLAAVLRGHGYARVRVTKRAVVDVREDTAQVTYGVDPGPACVFGPVDVQGLAAVDRDVVLREVAWRPGQPFDQKLIDETRKRLQDLRLFRTVRLDEDDSRQREVAITIAVTEAKQREVRLGVGYETAEGVRGLAAWRDYDFFGDARQLGFTARVSQLRRTIAADFLQPHWPLADGRTRLLFLQEQQDEDTYTLLLSRLNPRLEWSATDRLELYTFYRVEYDLLSGVKDAVKRALPDAHPNNALLSGLGFGVTWNATDDLLDPSRGWTTSLVAEPVGGPFGGEASFVRLIGEGRAYVPLVLRLVAASRLRLGTEQTFGGTTVVPLWERFYAGGINSVRGYARRRVGPLADDDPLGGQSLLETSFELRRPVTEQVGVAVFVDGGQLSLQSAHWAWPAMQWGTGAGVRLKTPVGPVRVDIGIPLDRHGSDNAWQFYLSVGQTF